MTFETIRALLGWCALINLAIVTLYFLIFIAAHDAIYALHSRWFALSRERFDTILYASLAYYKLTTLAFFVVPYGVMRLFM